MNILPPIVFLLLVMGSSLALAAKDEKLTLAEAEKIALKNDPLIARLSSLKDGFAQQAVAAGTWPDPKIKIGAMNVPIDEFAFDKEPMTQKVVGFKQMFPPAGLVGSKKNRLVSLSDATELGKKDRSFQTLRNVRLSWLSVYFSYQSQKLVEKSLQVFGQLKKVTRFQYRSGRGEQQDVIRAQLEESLLFDKESQLENDYQIALSLLKQWLSIEKLDRPLDMEFPELPKLLSEKQILTGLDKHPWVKAGEARVKAAESGVKSADAQFNPGWSVDLSYGMRDAEAFDDVISAMLMFDLPLFTGNRQSKLLQASQSRLSAAKYTLDDLRRKIRRRFEQGLSTYQRTEDRLELYNLQVMPQARQNTEAALKAYKSGVSAFSVVVRARLTELNTRLQNLALTVKRAKAQVELLYLMAN